MRALIAAVTAVMLVVATACSSDAAPPRTYEALTASIGASLAVLGWHIKVDNLRFDADHVLVDVDASATGGDRAKPEDIRFGLYGALSHPLEANGLAGCTGVNSLGIRPLAAAGPDKLTGTVCLGPLRDQSQVRGVYVYSPRERIPKIAILVGDMTPDDVAREAADSIERERRERIVPWRGRWIYRLTPTTLAEVASGPHRLETRGQLVNVGVSVRSLIDRREGDFEDRIAQGDVEECRGSIMLLLTNVFPTFAILGQFGRLRSK